MPRFDTRILPNVLGRVVGQFVKTAEWTWKCLVTLHRCLVHKASQACVHVIGQYCLETYRGPRRCMCASCPFNLGNSIVEECRTCRILCRKTFVCKDRAKLDPYIFTTMCRVRPAVMWTILILFLVGVCRDSHVSTPPIYDVRPPWKALDEFNENWRMSGVHT